MIKFRNINYDTDLESILCLIKENLDKDFTLDLFKWKHLENPFGISYGLIAIDDNRIIGLRMFMYWRFKSTNLDSYLALRPVDTVVDKKYQGRGLFKKLTLEGIKNCSYDFIFNTPNNNSLKGYLKMGWNEFENVKKYKISLVNPFSSRIGYSETLIDNINFYEDEKNGIYTSINPSFIKWRYKNNKYRVITYDNSYVIFSKAYSNHFPFVIIYELIGKKDNFQKLLSAIGRYISPILYHYDDINFDEVKFLKSFSRQVPTVVIKDISKSTNVLSNLNFSLGDLEGAL